MAVVGDLAVVALRGAGRDMGRILNNLFYPPFLARRTFSDAALRKISDTISAAEAEQGCEIVFIVEGALDLKHFWRGMTSWDRAVDLFASNRVWDTEDNTGILIYVLMAEHAVEIVADRGVIAKISTEELAQVMHEITIEIRKQNEVQGVITGIASLARLLKPHFPSKKRNELGDEALRLK